MSEGPRKLEINWVQAAAGALAAMSSAVLLSTIGVAGTLVGAAVGSVVVTLGNAVYSHYFQLSRERVFAAHAAARLRVERARADVQGTAAEAGSAAGSPAGNGVGLDAAERELGAAEQDLTAQEGRPVHVGLREALSGLPWKRLAWIAAAIFVVAMLVILTFELITGRAVSTYTGGSDDRPRTSIGLGGDEKPKPPTPTPTPSPSKRPSDTASRTPEETPTAEPTSATPSPTATETAVSPVPAETASELPSSSTPPPSETLEPPSPEPSS